MLEYIREKQREGFDSRRCLAVSCQKLGDISEAEENLSHANSWFEKDLEILSELAEETDIVVFRMDLSTTYNRLGGIHRSEGHLTEARSLFGKALEVNPYAILIGEANDPWKNFTDSCYGLGEISTEEGNLGQARFWLDKAMEISHELAEKREHLDPGKILLFFIISLEISAYW